MFNCNPGTVTKNLPRQTADQNVVFDCGDPHLHLRVTWLVGARQGQMFFSRTGMINQRLWGGEVSTFEWVVQLWALVISRLKVSTTCLLSSWHAPQWTWQCQKENRQCLDRRTFIHWMFDTVSSWTSGVWQSRNSEIINHHMKAPWWDVKSGYYTITQSSRYTPHGTITFSLFPESSTELRPSPEPGTSPSQSIAH